MDDGLWWIWMSQEIYVFNGTKHVVQVTFGAGPVCAVDIGTGSVFPVTMKTSMVTLSYYTDARDLKSIVLRDSGSWTTSLTPMVAASCYTKDRQPETSACVRRRTRGSN